MQGSRIFVLLVGYFFFLFQRLIGMACGWEGIAYYKEVHVSLWNSIVHSVFMPVTMTGMFVWVPALFDLDKFAAFELRVHACLFYLGLYCEISIPITMLGVLLYAVPFGYSNDLYERCRTRRLRLITGILISVTALLIQEVFGHALAGDPPSRLEAIPNAIFYAIFYSVSHFF